MQGRLSFAESRANGVAPKQLRPFRVFGVRAALTGDSSARIAPWIGHLEPFFMLVTDATGAPPDSQRRDFMRISRTRAFLLAILLIASWLLVYDWARTSRSGAIPA